MSIHILDNARAYLVASLKGKRNGFETKHPWRKDWEFAVLHSLRVESYTLKILARENHLLSEPEVILLRLAAILHDIARLENRETHAILGAEIARKWFQEDPGCSINRDDLEKVVEMIAGHSNKSVHEPDFSKAVLKDADTLDEIGIMSIFMASNWIETQTPFFFYNLRQRLIDVEIPFCDKKLTMLNTGGAKEILSEKKAFIESFIAQMTDEIQVDCRIEQMLLGLSRNSS
jgi:putative nucleotidyltransferase with HDIG domain